QRRPQERPQHMRTPADLDGGKCEDRHQIAKIVGAYDIVDMRVQRAGDADSEGRHHQADQLDLYHVDADGFYQGVIVPDALNTMPRFEISQRYISRISAPHSRTLSAGIQGPSVCGGKMPMMPELPPSHSTRV